MLELQPSGWEQKSMHSNKLNEWLGAGAVTFGTLSTDTG
jgi:hypothetical protein